MRYTALLLAVLLAGCHKGEETFTVPASACSEQSTGETRDYTIQGACLFSQKVGDVEVCTVYQQIPITERKTRVRCEFTRWK